MVYPVIMNNIIYKRVIETQIQQALFESGKVVILFGPRQAGKTTLAKKILADNDSERGYFNCEELPVKDVLESFDSRRMMAFFGGNKIMVLDEAQSVPDIGKALKIFVDAYPDINIMATGSSSFELANRVSEPLTGRKHEFFLSPISFEEIAKTAGNAELISTIGKRIIFGSYPEILTAKSDVQARERLESLASSYLYRDVLQYGGIKNPQVLSKILRALAHQIGSGISYNQISKTVQLDRKTVVSYVDLLEQAFIIFRLRPLTNAPLDEIKRQDKIYFYDNGIINTLTGNFSPPDTGRDMGALWENLMVSERKKRNTNHRLFQHSYYWRMKSGPEIDLVEDCDGIYHPFEFKWQRGRSNKNAAKFAELYGGEPAQTITKHDFLDFVT
jgi:predicted AAA+ superfamily ATPase